MNSTRDSKGAKTRMVKQKTKVIHRFLWITFLFENGFAKPFWLRSAAGGNKTYPQNIKMRIQAEIRESGEKIQRM